MVVTEIHQQKQQPPKKQFWTFSSREKRLAAAQAEARNDQDISFTKFKKWRKLYSDKVNVRSEIEIEN